VGDSIVVTVIRLSGDKVRLGIEAPADMLVLRDELEPYAQDSLPAVPAALTAPIVLNAPVAPAESAGPAGV
jgi:carbon storage regulator